MSRASTSVGTPCPKQFVSSSDMSQEQLPSISTSRTTTVNARKSAKQVVQTEYSIETLVCYQPRIDVAKAALPSDRSAAQAA
ncbi:hypothetical protein OPT61_g8544 [Boeremia exigua]|uniref:Uncharacterized protein n=1 Tax=Boeremia exigua TaxID=749465 RepID=A0ACC2HY91_9PLEO|nr:hypothetical protein OPT61_g8544 [Boeremia exigua]